MAFTCLWPGMSTKAFVETIFCNQVGATAVSLVNLPKGLESIYNRSMWTPACSLEQNQPEARYG